MRSVAGRDGELASRRETRRQFGVDQEEVAIISVVNNRSRVSSRVCRAPRESV